MSAVEFLLVAAGLVAPGAAQGDYSVNDLIAQLDGLTADVDRTAFLQRPALMELIARGPEAAPALARAAEQSPSASIRASAAYALYVNRLHEGPLSPVETAWGTQLRHPSPLVRAVAGMLAKTEEGYRVLKEPETAMAFKRVFVDLSARSGPVDWLPEDYYDRRLQAFARMARIARDFEGDRPTWDFVHAVEPTPEALLARGIFRSEMIRSSRSHRAARAALDLVLTEVDRRPEAAAHLLQIAETIPDHQEPGVDSHAACPIQGELLTPLLGLVERHVWSARDPATLDALINLLAGLGAVPGGPELLARVASEHPVAEAREAAAHEMDAAKRLNSPTRAIRERTDDTSRRRPPGIAPAVAPPSNTPSRNAPSRSSTDDPEPESPASRWPWFAAAALAAGVLLVIWRGRPRGSDDARPGSFFE